MRRSITSPRFRRSSRLGSSRPWRRFWPDAKTAREAAGPLEQRGRHAGGVDIKSLIRTIPDYPKPGILFRDITTLIADPAGLRAAIDGLVLRRSSTAGIDHVAGIEARGFILGGAVAHELGRGFVPIRKKGKLPWRTIGQEYSLEYGVDTIEIHADAIQPGDRVLLVDDLIATGGTAEAATELIRRSGGEIVAAAFVIDLPDLGGARRLAAKRRQGPHPRQLRRTLSMADFHIYIGYRTVSTWSLRGWLPMKKTGVPFDETLIRYRTPEGKATLIALSPTGKVPLPRPQAPDGGEVKVWDSLAIGEYLAETVPGSAAVAGRCRRRAPTPAPSRRRCIPASGALREHLSMALLERHPEALTIRRPTPRSPASRRSGASAASAGARPAAGRSCSATGPSPTRMYAPVVTRFRTYGVKLATTGAAYMEAVLADPDFLAWEDQAQARPAAGAADDRSTQRLS